MEIAVFWGKVALVAVAFGLCFLFRGENKQQ